MRRGDRSTPGAGQAGDRTHHIRRNPHPPAARRRPYAPGQRPGRRSALEVLWCRTLRTGVARHRGQPVADTRAQQRAHYASACRHSPARDLDGLFDREGEGLLAHDWAGPVRWCNLAPDVMVRSTWSTTVRRRSPRTGGREGGRRVRRRGTCKCVRRICRIRNNAKRGESVVPQCDAITVKAAASR